MEFWTLVVIILIISLAFGIFFEFVLLKDVKESTGGVTLGGTCLMMIVFGMILLNMGSNKMNTTGYIYKNKTAIRSIEDNLGVKGNIEGSFVLGCGYINGQTDSNLYYYILVGDGENGYVVNKYNASEIHLIPEENIEPYYVERHAEIDQIASLGFLDKYFKPNIQKLVCLDQKELHLPKNYIKQNINIDMK